MATATQPSSAQPASMFGMPGITRPIETKENNDGATVTLASGSSTTQTGLIPFRQTDVIYGWILETAYANTLTPGTGTITVGDYFPDSFLGNVQLNMQNQFSTINVESGIDLALFQLLRPMRKADRRNSSWANPAAGLYNTTTNPVTASNYSNSSTAVRRRYELPAGMWFDRYFELDPNGNALNSQPLSVFVSPQYMAGTARIVTPQLTFAPLAGTTADLGPYTKTGVATIASTATESWRRVGIYQPQGQADSPPVFNWQYVRKTQRFSLSGVSTANLNVPLNGQILGLYVRLYDPSANSSLGAPIDVSSGGVVSECDIVYGSGLYRYQDTTTDTIARNISKHGYTITKGTLMWDFGQDEQDNVTNRYALNTMNTSGIQIQLTFTGAQSSTAYATVGVEALQYVEL